MCFDTPRLLITAPSHELFLTVVCCDVRRKRGEREASETPQLLIARKLTLERIEELRELMKQEQDEYRSVAVPVSTSTGQYQYRSVAVSVTSSTSPWLYLSVAVLITSIASWCDCQFTQIPLPNPIFSIVPEVMW